MGLTIPDSLNVKQDETIAIKADDWNSLNSKLDRFNQWLQETKEVSSGIHYSVEPATYTPSKDYNIFNNIKTTKVSTNDVIKADNYNELVNKINTWALTKQNEAIANNTIISANLINSLMGQLKYLPTSITINVIYYDPIYFEGAIIGWNTTPGTQTFEFEE